MARLKSLPNSGHYCVLLVVLGICASLESACTRHSSVSMTDGTFAPSQTPDAPSPFGQQAVLVPGGVLQVSPPINEVNPTEVVYPPDTFATAQGGLGIANIKTLYGAKGDGKTDDSAAIVKAVHDYAGNGAGLIYFPAGTYMINQQLIYQNNAGIWGANLVLQGENQATTTIQLFNKSPGFTDPSNPKAMIYTASDQGAPTDGSGNEGFYNHIMNLTINTGSGNPGAIGIHYMANNDSRISDVSVVSGDGTGVYGISALVGYPGPYFIKNVTVSGFATGMALSGGDTYGGWLEHITLNGQSVSGIDIVQGTFSFRDVTSTDTVPAIRVAPPVFALPTWESSLSVIDSHFNGGSPSHSAIMIPNPSVYQPAIFVRNSVSSGYASLVNNAGTLVPSGTSEWTSEAPLKLSPRSPGTSLNLPIEETPTYVDNDFSNWANVQSYGAVAVFANFNAVDSTAAIQAAIDSGKTTVYFPPGLYAITNTIHLRGNIQRFLMLQAALEPLNDAYPQGTPAISIDATLAPNVLIRNLVLTDNCWDYFDASRFATFAPPYVPGTQYKPFNLINSSPSTVTIMDSAGFTYQNVPPPDGKPAPLFLENVFTGEDEFYNQTVYARNLDPENGDINAHVAVHGGSLWALGIKIEGILGSVLQVDSGAQVEVLGLAAATFALDPAQTPMASNLESSLSISAYSTNSYIEQVCPIPGFPAYFGQCGTSGVFQPTDYTATISETLSGVSQTLYGAALGLPAPALSAYSRNGAGSNISLFADYGVGTQASAVTCSLSVTAPEGITGPNGGYEIPILPGNTTATAKWTVRSSMPGLTASWYGMADGILTNIGTPAGPVPGSQTITYNTNQSGTVFVQSMALTDIYGNVACVTKPFRVLVKASGS